MPRSNTLIHALIDEIKTQMTRRTLAPKSLTQTSRTLFVTSGLLLTSHVGATTLPKVYIHADNLFDYRQLLTGDKSNLSTDTNLLAINGVSAEVTYEYMNLKRSESFMAKGQPICIINKVKTRHRENRYLFTLPVNLFLNRRLYQLSHEQPLETSNAPVSLPALFQQHPDKKMLLTSHISYGERLDQQLQSIPNKNKIYRNSMNVADNKLNGISQGLMAMFEMRRAEFALFYPQQLQETKVNFSYRSYPLANIEPYQIGHIMCADVPGMPSFVAQLDFNIQKAFAQGDWYQTHHQHLNHQDQQVFDMYYHEVAPLLE